MKKIIGKLLIVIVPIIGVLLLLYPTYRASELEELKQEALKRAKMAPTPADSLKIMEEFEAQYGQALLSAKQNRIKLGLDLRGGMYVTLEVDIIKLIEESADPAEIDDVFTEALEKTKNQLKDAGDVDAVELFKKNFDEVAKTSGRKRYLSDYFDFGYQGSIEELEKRILEHLKNDEKEALDQAMEVIRQRIDKYGIAEPTIQKQGGRRILLELPGVTNEQEMRQLLQTTARLEFKLVLNNQDLVQAFYEIDKLLSKQAKLKKALGEKDSTFVVDTSSSELASLDTTKTEKDTTIAKEDTTAKKADTTNPYEGLSDEEFRKRYLEDHPFTTLFETYYIPEGKNQRPQRIGYAVNAFPKGSYNFQIFETTINRFKEIINRREVKEKLPPGIQILFSAKPDKFKDNTGKEIKAWNFYALKKEPLLTGEVIINAQATYDPQTNEPIVTMAMNTEGAEEWAKITGKYLKERIGIVLDDMVYSAPVVQSKIIGGNSQISGMSSPDEAKLLKIVLKAGSLRAPVKIIEERIVGPSLGEDSINSGLTAIFIASILVILFMAIYYAVGGLIANFAVILNVSIIIAVLAAFQGTLTLPGIAGIILTLGMAVDANILIYERIREELYKGRSMRSAIDEGYSKAMSAILDSNITTFITGLILYFFGTGPIQGFAMTIMIGILATLFTQIVVTRAIIEIMLSLGVTNLNVGQVKTITQTS